MVIRRAQETGGFTLFELLVVLVILTVVTGMAVLGLGYATERGLNDVHARLQAGLFELGTQAALKNTSYRLDFASHGFELFRWNGQGWQALAVPDILALPDSVRLRVRDADVQGERPQYLFLPTGQVSPTLRLELGDAEQALPLTWPAGLEDNETLDAQS